MRAAALGAAVVLGACSSAPQRPMRITDVYDRAADYYESANTELGAGLLAEARAHLVQAHTAALSIDALDLLCRIKLSGISYKVSAGEAAGGTAGTSADSSTGGGTFLDERAEKILADAQGCARRTARSTLLLAVCDIYAVRLALTGGGTDYAAYLSTLAAAEKKLSGEPYYRGHLYRTRGDIFIAQHDYAAAESAFKSAADVHTKNSYLVEIGTDWYGVARCRSNAGKKADAITAIETALKYDKDAENTAAIGTDYYAYAKIVLKGNPTAEERALAKSLALWSAAVFTAGGFDGEAVASEALAASIAP